MVRSFARDGKVVGSNLSSLVVVIDLWNINFR